MMGTNVDGFVFVDVEQAKKTWRKRHRMPNDAVKIAIDNMVEECGRNIWIEGYVAGWKAACQSAEKRS